MGTGPPAEVLAVPSRGPRVGLIASLGGVNAVEDTSLDWQRSFAVEPELCDEGGIADPCTPGTWPAVVGTSRDILTTEPFVVWAPDVCTTLDGRDSIGRARRQLESILSKRIASELWTGDQAVNASWPNRYLASEASDVVSPGSGITPTEALACLEQALAECSGGERGMIHATRQTVTHWAAAGLVRREGPLVLTTLDTIVVPDAGYDGSGPTGLVASDGNVWAYATDMVSVRVGPVQQTSDVDRLLNTQRTRAFRVAAVTWDGCCHAAAQIDIDTCGIGGS